MLRDIIKSLILKHYKKKLYKELKEAKLAKDVADVRDKYLLKIEKLWLPRKLKDEVLDEIYDYIYLRIDDE